MPTSLPPDVRLPTEDEPGWERMREPGEPTTPDELAKLVGLRMATVCYEHAWIPAPGATDLVAAERAGQDGLQSRETLTLFTDAGAAAAYLASLRSGWEACGDPLGGVVQDYPGPWGQSFAWTQAEPRQVPTETMVGVRIGSAVVVVSRYLESGQAVTDTEFRRGLDRLAPELCRYTAAGC